MLVLGRRKKIWGNPRFGIRENDEEVVIGDDVARTYLLGTTLLGDPLWDPELGRLRLAEVESALLGFDASAGTRLTKSSPVELECMEVEFNEEAPYHEVRLCSDEAIYLDHNTFGSEGVMVVVARLVHATQVRLGFVAHRDVKIHRLEVFRRIQQRNQVGVSTCPVATPPDLPTMEGSTQ